MPKQKKPDAGVEQNTVKESSDQVQQTLPAVVGETAPAADTAPTVDAKLIEEAVRFINEKYNETVYKGAMEIGAYVLKHFFNDDIALASSRNPRKATSYRALCQAAGLIPRPETLSVMVRVAAQEKFFLSKKLETGSLSYTHKAELVKLPNDVEKVKLVKSAIKKALTTRQLEERIEAIKKQQVKEAKPIAQFFDKEIGNPEKLFGEAAVLQLLEDRGGLQQELKQLKPKKLKALSVKATKRAEETKKWAQLYQDLVDAIEEISAKE